MKSPTFLKTVQFMLVIIIFETSPNLYTYVYVQKFHHHSGTPVVIATKLSTYITYNLGTITVGVSISSTPRCRGGKE